MNKYSLCLIISLLTVLVSSYLLISGSQLLTLPLDSNDTIPLGSFITWAGMMSLPLSLYFASHKLRDPTKTIHRFLSVVLKLLIGLGVLWLPISYALAGNLAFNFTESPTFQGGQLAMKCFWALTYAIVICVFAVALIHVISKFTRK